MQDFDLVGKTDCVFSVKLASMKVLKALALV